MNKIAKKLLTAALCLATVLTLVPVVAFQTEAASGDVTNEGIVLFEDDFNYSSLDEAIAGGWMNTDLVGKHASFDGECMIIDAFDSKDTLVYIDYKLSDLGIPSYFKSGTTSDYVDVAVRIELVVSAEKRSYSLQLRDFNFQNREGTTLSGTHYKSTPGDNQIGKTSSAAFETISITVNPTTAYNQENFWDQVVIRVGARKGDDATVTSAGTDFVKIDSVKVTLLPSTGSYNKFYMQTMLSSKNAYVKLDKDIDATTQGALTMGENAVLDLNGHTLTATMVSPGTNATIIDSSENKSGKLIVPKDSLVLRSGNPQLPLWAGDGYIFAKPVLGDERAFVVPGESSANGFKMDFRPGFGTEIREKYLSKGNTGVQMTAQLSWTDIFGNKGSLDGGLDGTSIFNQMYKTPTARGRLWVVGAEKFRDISLAISLKSCGVEVNFEPLTFNNTFVTTHFAADFETGTISNSDSNFNVGKMKTFGETAVIQESGNKVLNVSKSGANVITFAQNITAGANKTLVLEYDLYTDGGHDYYAFTRRYSGGQRDTVLGAGGYQDAGDMNGNIYAPTSTSPNRYISVAGEYVRIRMTIDLGTGAWNLYRNGTRLTGGTYNKTAGMFENLDTLYLYPGDNADVHHFDNMLIYTVTN